MPSVLDDDLDQVGATTGDSRDAAKVSPDDANLSRPPPTPPLTAPAGQAEIGVVVDPGQGRDELPRVSGYFFTLDEAGSVRNDTGIPTARILQTAQETGLPIFVRQAGRLFRGRLDASGHTLTVLDPVVPTNVVAGSLAMSQDRQHALLDQHLEDHTQAGRLIADTIPRKAAQPSKEGIPKILYIPPIAAATPSAGPVTPPPVSPTPTVTTTATGEAAMPPPAGPESGPEPTPTPGPIPEPPPAPQPEDGPTPSPVGPTPEPATSQETTAQSTSPESESPEPQPATPDMAEPAGDFSATAEPVDTASPAYAAGPIPTVPAGQPSAEGEHPGGSPVTPQFGALNASAAPAEVGKRTGAATPTSPTRRRQLRHRPSPPVTDGAGRTVEVELPSDEVDQPMIVPPGMEPSPAAETGEDVPTGTAPVTTPTDTATTGRRPTRRVADHQASSRPSADVSPTPGTAGSEPAVIPEEASPAYVAGAPQSRRTTGRPSTPTEAEPLLAPVAPSAPSETPEQPAVPIEPGAESPETVGGGVLQGVNEPYEPYTAPSPIQAEGAEGSPEEEGEEDEEPDEGGPTVSQQLRGQKIDALKNQYPKMRALVNSKKTMRAAFGDASEEMKQALQDEIAHSVWWVNYMVNFYYKKGWQYLQEVFEDLALSFADFFLISGPVSLGLYLSRWMLGNLLGPMFTKEIKAPLPQAVQGEKDLFVKVKIFPPYSLVDSLDYVRHMKALLILCLTAIVYGFIFMLLYVLQNQWEALKQLFPLSVDSLKAAWWVITSLFPTLF